MAPGDTTFDKNPLLCIFTSYATGIFLAPFFLPPPDAWLLSAAVLFLAGTIWVENFRWLFFTLFVALFGFSAYHLKLCAPDDSHHVVRLAGSESTIEGHVESLSRKPAGAVLLLNVNWLLTRVNRTPLTGKVLLFIAEGCPDVSPGDHIRVRARLRRPQKFGVPGEFDYPRHLAQSRIFVVAALPDARAIVKLAGNKRVNLPTSIESYRHRIQTSIDSLIHPKLAPFLRALTVGDRRGLGPEERNLLARGGLSHLFAISGLHMGILFFFLYAPLKYLYCRSERLLLLAPPRQIVPLLVLPFLFFYLLLSGCGAPTQRAFLALSLGSVLVCLERYTSPIRILFTVAFTVLLLDPPSLFSSSYQLSFASAGAILHFSPLWHKKLPSCPFLLRYPVNLFFLTLTATLATLPFVLVHFHMLPLAGLLINLFAVPLVTFLALPCALAGAAFICILPCLGSFFFRQSALFLEWTLNLVKLLMNLLSVDSNLFFLTPLESATLFFLVFLASYHFKAHATNRAKILTACFICGCLMILSFSSEKRFMLTALHVGHGDALIISKNGKTYLVDGGGFYTDNFDVGERLVAPALGRLGIKKLEAVILTHAHPDHFKGLAYVLDHFKVGEFWSAMDRSELPEIIQKSLERKVIPVVRFPQGWTILHENPGDALSIFVPRQRTTNINDRSLVVFAREGNNSLLLTGDLEKGGVWELLRASIYREATLLKLPHHGSPHSAPEELVNFFRPQLVFATTAKAISERIRGNSTEPAWRPLYFNLSDHGTPTSVRFVATPRGWDVRYWRRGLFR